MIACLVNLRNKIVNAWNRAFYVGCFVDFPSWCDKRGVKYDRSFYDRLIAPRPIARLECCRVALKFLRSNHLGIKYKMADSPVFKSLLGHESYFVYKEKCAAYGDLSHENVPDDWPLKVREWVRTSGDAPFWPIIINQKNMILDGQHRACCALLDFGDNHKVEAIRVFFLPESGSWLNRLVKRFCGGKTCARDDGLTNGGPDMRFFIKRFLVLVSIPILAALLWSIFMVSVDFRTYRESLMCPAGRDIAVCGDSQTRAALDPSIIPRLFNFSTAATHPDQNFLRLLDFLDVNSGKIKYVLLDVTPLHIGFDERISPLSEAGSARVHAFVHIYRWRDSLRPLGSVMRLFRDVVLIRKPNEIRKVIKRGLPYRSSLSGGFYSAKYSGFIDYPEKAHEYAKKMADKFNSKPEFSHNERIVGILKASVSAIEKAGACPLLMTTPIASSALIRMEKEKLFAFTNGLAVVAADLGIPYLNHLSENIPEECWRDANHLNEKGAERFSVMFKRELKRVCQHFK